MPFASMHPSRYGRDCGCQFGLLRHDRDVDEELPWNRVETALFGGTHEPPEPPQTPTLLRHSGGALGHHEVLLRHAAELLKQYASGVTGRSCHEIVGTLIN